MSEEAKENYILAIISITIPFIILRFAEFASMTIWAFPFVLIIIFLMFNNRKMLVVLSISSLATQGLLLVMAQDTVVQVKAMEFIGRIVLYLIAIWMALYLNRLNMLRQKENNDQILVQKNIADICTNFVTVNHLNVNEKINIMLEKTGRVFGVNRAHVFILDYIKNEAVCTHSWHDSGRRPEEYSKDTFPLFMYPWLFDQFSKNDGTVHIFDVEMMPEEAFMEKSMLLKRNIKSIISVPILGNNQMQGFLGFVNVKARKKWDENHISTLKIMSNLTSYALSKVESEEKQEFMAYYDQLTLLANRTLFNDRLNQAIYSANRNENTFAVMFLDLDTFKNINDTLGHENGDMLLKCVANKLSQNVRKSDTVARFGGDEFLILINNISNIKSIGRIAGNILSIFEMPFNIGGQDLFVTGSAGISVYPMDGSDVDTLIKNADIAMYKAKENGKNQFQLCTPNMKYEIQNAVEITNSLYHVQERDELHVYYQPQIDIKSGLIVGLEALLRWNHPKLGKISPNIFIPLAEKTGLINPIGEWVLRTACYQNKKWQDMGFPPVRVGVNLSFVQFKSNNIVDKVTEILQETGMNPEYLDLEITESTVVCETSDIIDSLKRLKELGVCISIDDFGTDYSSLSRLKLLPIDQIKMDIQFVRGIDESERDQAYATLIINLAKNLGLKLIAEGVETRTQFQFLQHKECDQIQGYYYYKPMSAYEIEALFRNVFTDNIKQIN